MRQDLELVEQLLQGGALGLEASDQGLEVGDSGVHALPFVHLARRP